MKKQLYFDVVPDRRFIKRNGNYALRLRISSGKTKWYFPVMLEASEEMYERAHSPKPRKEEKELRDRIEAIKSEARTVTDGMPEFTPEAFKKAFLKEASAPPTVPDVFTAFQKYMDQLKTENRIGTAKTYYGTMQSIAAFCHGKLKEHKESITSGKKKPVTKLPKLRFEDVTVHWLKRYSAALEALGTSHATIGIYCRTLRAIYNEAIQTDPTLKLIYPFGKGKFEIPSAQKNKRALSLGAIKAIFDYEPRSLPEQRAKDFWIFSYLCNGINVADLIRLKYSQLQFHEEGCTITFLRQKTQRSKSDKTENVIELDTAPTEHIRSIIARHGNKSKSGYIFPYLNDKNTSQEQHDAKTTFVRVLNKSLHKIAKNLELPIDLTTYTARHSYATVLLRSGVSVAAISEALGHSDLKTTESYLGGFSSESKRQNSKNLLNF